MMVEKIQLSTENYCSLIRLHLTNVVGMGASQLLLSLLPELLKDSSVTVEVVYLPDRGPLSSFQSGCVSTLMAVYRRCLPNALSRFLECTLLASRFDGLSPLLVFGDLPLRCRGTQTLFVQQSNLFRPKSFTLNLSGFKYLISRFIFKINIDRVRSIIVQTDLMRMALERAYPSVVGRVHVISQPVPEWLLHSKLRRRAPVRPVSEQLRLIYPAASYPHKNHQLLSSVDATLDWPVEQLILTLDTSAHPARYLSWVHCGGLLSPTAMIAAYTQVDALLFLSKEESYGFPLLEAMFIGLPVVCPNLPYAHILCGDEAIYFDPDSGESLRLALLTLKTRLSAGWWPCWDQQLVNIPKDWQTVARRMLEIAINP